MLLDGEVFLGRKAEVEMLSEWIKNSTVNIISIVGSPGFGMSTLAIHLGQVSQKMVVLLCTMLTYMRYLIVLKEKLILLVCDEYRLSFDVQHLSMWASKLKIPTVLILDNCDELLHKFKDAFQNLIKNLVRHSRFLKMLLTAKQMTSFLGSCRATNILCCRCTSEVEQHFKWNDGSGDRCFGRECTTCSTSSWIVTDTSRPINNS